MEVSNHVPYSIVELHGLFLVPETEANVLVTVSVADTGDTVFAPSECTRSGVVVREV
jgi:hypothetical protein